MSQYSASPRLGHLEGLYHIFEYIRKLEMSREVFGTFQPQVYGSEFMSGTTDWKGFYGDIKEELTTGIPEPLGKSAHMTHF